MTTNKQLVLFGESFSPWTKKARWALEHCDLSYNYKEYTPTLSEPGLRLRLKQLTGSISVPLMFVDGKVIRGSWDIAHYANEAVGDGRLGILEQITQWNFLSEDALAEGRTRVVRCIRDNNQALEESLPSFVPNLLHRPMRFIARDAVKRLDKKYAGLVKPGSLRKALLQTRQGLSQSGGDYLLGTFSYADIAMAAVIEVIAPIAHVEPPLGTEIKQCWNNPKLAVEFKDLVDWRNRLASTASTSYSQFTPA